MKKITLLLAGLLIPAASCFLIAQPIDKAATKETRALLGNLKKLIPGNILFGHQDDLAYGVGWSYEAGRSDVKEVVGEYPALYGWDIAGLEKGDGLLNIDSVPFPKMREYIQQGYQRGGAITVSWHLDHPVTGNNAWDTTHGGVTAVLPGGSANKLYKAWLNKVAAFSLSLKGSRGEPVPVLFRPFHELTGNWFWWTKNTCTPAEFKALWQYTVRYLRDTTGVHNFLYVYNTASFASGADFMERYPGNDYVDMISFDDYQYGDPTKKDNGFLKGLKAKLTMLDSLSTELGKPAALGETGYEAIPYREWWTKILYEAIAPHHLSYVLLWRNHGKQSNGNMHYYVPFKGQVSASDFKKFAGKEKMIFEKKARAAKLYSEN